MPSFTELLVQLTIAALGGVVMTWCFSPALFCAANELMCGWP